MPRSERGYILMITLLLLAIAALALAQVSRASLAQAVEAKAAQGELQRRWGILSCQAALLPEAETRLKQIEQQTGEPAPSTAITITLGDQTFDLLIADEQAKVNIHTLYQRRGRQTAQSNIRSLVRLSTDGVAVRIRPLEARSETDGQAATDLPALGSFAQVFADASPGQLIGFDEKPAATTYCTCWGNGKLNVLRAGRPALKQLCEDVINDNQIDELISARAETQIAETDDLLNQLGLTKRKKDQLTELFTNTSACHSLWIVVRNHDRTWHRLAILEVTDDREEPNRTYTFAW